MPSLAHLLPFLLATVLIAIIPGPAILYTVAQTLARGRAAGFRAATGIAVGDLVHVAAAAAGLSAVFRWSPTLFLAVKIFGAAYLVWLGVRMVRSRHAADALPQVAQKTARRAFAESVTVELLNPKTALFFIAFLPQFVDPAAGLPVWAQFLVLGLIVNAVFFAADVVTLLCIDQAMARLRRSARVARWLRVGSGSALVGLGAHMALSRN
ncbi:threonine/homoserine/homoserine lactone efflux protein [Inquilinus ginsengisoli]|uniref:Threonine/homoserine/homoserine lactone efflux protein n=1 Tax=Inquilinus ginsengisoli TaxID=363840 RepID=A0ABU1JW95_9PROT|nr:LysE family translocator [Inquilinus ginsengisoli]MDR6292274.1 threonine/homoserine/homoserine lactone efflux protein [Inquilinus ginsengisoli]